MSADKTRTRAFLLRRLAQLDSLGTYDEWYCRTEKNGIGDYGRDEHYRTKDRRIEFALRISFNPPKTTVLYFREVSL